jgi:hypothetical protein
MESENLEGVKVGDELILFLVSAGYGRAGKEWERGRPVVVTKVGRKLLYATYPESVGTPGDRPTAYRIENGVINDNYGHTQVCTPAHVAEREARRAARERLREFGLDFYAHAREELSTARLTAVVEFLEETAD